MTQYTKVQIEQEALIYPKNKLAEKVINEFGNKFKVQSITDSLSFNSKKGTWLRLVGVQVNKPPYSFWFFHNELLRGDDDNFEIELKEKYKKH